VDIEASACVLSSRYVDVMLYTRCGKYLPLPDDGRARRGRREAPEHRGGSPSPVWRSGGYASRKFFKKSTLKSHIFCSLSFLMEQLAFIAASNSSSSKQERFLGPALKRRRRRRLFIGEVWGGVSISQLAWCLWRGLLAHFAGKIAIYMQKRLNLVHILRHMKLLTGI